MAEEKLVTITNNDTTTIKLDVIAPTNKVDVNLSGSVDSMFFIHNADDNAHSEIIQKVEDGINAEISQVNAKIGLKADSASIYTKGETDSLLSAKINASDTSLTLQGNSFNAANQLVLLDSNGQLPALDCRNLINNIGNLRINALGAIASPSTVTLVANCVNTCTLSGSVTFKLPAAANLISGIENKVILYFFQTSSVLPVFFGSSKIKWSNKSNYKAPTYYPTSGRNIVEFKTHDDGATWEAEATIYGATEQTFATPTNMTANGTIDGASFAVYAALGSTPAYYAFDGNASTCLTLSASGSLKIYNPVRIRATSFRITNSTQANGFIQNYSLYGVDDNSVSILLASGTNTTLVASASWDIGIYAPAYYQTYILFVSSTTPSTTASISSVNITGTYTL